jgi:hypothetical protein
VSAGGSDGRALGGVRGRYLLAAGAVRHLSGEGAGIPADSGGTGERSRRCYCACRKKVLKRSGRSMVPQLYYVLFDNIVQPNIYELARGLRRCGKSCAKGSDWRYSDPGSSLELIGSGAWVLSSTLDVTVGTNPDLALSWRFLWKSRLNWLNLMSLPLSGKRYTAGLKDKEPYPWRTQEWTRPAVQFK